MFFRSVSGLALFVASSATIVTFPLQAQPAVEIPVAATADLAELTLAAATIVRARIADTDEVRAERAPGLAPGFRRLLVEAEVVAVLAAPGAVPGDIRYLVDVPETRRGRAPRLEGEEVMLFLGPEHRPGEFALAHKYGQQSWSGGTDEAVRKLLNNRAQMRGLTLGDAAVTSAFHVPGTIAGESESQIFVRTGEGRPLSLVVLRRPGQAPRVSVATGDIIDPNAPPPERGSLPALVLACSLPESLPGEVLEGSRDADALRADYQAAREALGGCERNFEQAALR
ncbi:hypothetical protein B5C34_13940 [Pacificimonas flava]|uniref:Uncharacterized protein n=2 Tax=Pacificimonas TaxID=1960290 RepID=A0A219B7T5_9SPHN|nr:MULTISPECIES: hypothetical protein [Pacificimonas]MBZ6379927.1 hypothetical protein [Pacificimonas aurantium]OWV34450.1 hypothetical protein B5C34_13940 [Pacificimonas flava]